MEEFDGVVGLKPINDFIVMKSFSGFIIRKNCICAFSANNILILIFVVNFFKDREKI